MTLARARRPVQDEIAVLSDELTIEEFEEFDFGELRLQREVERFDGFQSRESGGGDPVANAVFVPLPDFERNKVGEIR